jgi:hypothetical protein
VVPKSQNHRIVHRRVTPRTRQKLPPTRILTIRGLAFLVRITIAFQPRRLRFARAAVGCKRRLARSFDSLNLSLANTPNIDDRNGEPNENGMERIVKELALGLVGGPLLKEMVRPIVFVSVPKFPVEKHAQHIPMGHEALRTVRCDFLKTPV